MNILFVTHESLKRTSVARAMMEDVTKLLDARGVCCAIMSADESEACVRKGRITYHSFKRTSYGEFSLSDVISFFLATPIFLSCVKGVEQVFFRSYPSILVFGPIAWLFRKRIIFDTRGLFFDELYDSGKLDSTILRSVLRQIEKLLLRMSTKVICVTKYQLDHYAKLCPSVRAKAVVAPNGAAKTPLSGDRRDGEILQLVYVGSLIKWHSPELVMEICRELKHLNVDYHLDVITADLARGEELFRNLGERVSVFERNFRERPLRYDMAFCLIKGGLSKRICFPVKFAEYVNSRTPVVVSSNVAVCVEMVKRYGLGLVVNADESPGKIAREICTFYKHSAQNISPLEFPAELSFEYQVNQIYKVLTG